MPTYIVLFCFFCFVFGYFMGSCIAGFVHGCKGKLVKQSVKANPYL